MGTADSHLRRVIPGDTIPCMMKNMEKAEAKNMEDILETTTLRELRKDRQLTIMGLARVAETTPAWLTYIERYGHVPGPDLRQRIADALNVSEAELWPDTQVSTQNRC